jgi:predicted ATPase/class 3 adenylate cyclase
MTEAPTELPTGTLTFLFTDIEGSTRLLHELGGDFGLVLDDHHRILRGVLSQYGGVELGSEGDAFFVAFTTAADAVNAAARMQRALADHSERSGVELLVRMGLHTGEGRLVGENYGGLDVHRAARISSTAHGGQVLLSAVTAHLALESPKLDKGLQIVDLGEFRLKDIAHPEHLLQLCIPGLRSDFPLPSALGDTLRLPPRLDEVIDRERERQDISKLRDGHRLVTLTGPGGTGKTTLAIEVAREAVEKFPGGIFFVDLAAIVDSTLVASTIAGALSLREQGSRPIIETVSDYLSGRKTLLLLDNFEQVVDAAPLISQLLHRAPELRVVVTSRAPLLLTGEHEYPVPPMSLPDLQRLPDLVRLADYESIRLFVQRAQSLRPSFALTADNARAITEICVRLDGLPLAIELAAARIRLLSPNDILDRLDRSLSLLSGASRDVPQRQRTLLDAIGWSYDLLDGAHQTLFRRLAVFRGGWTLEAAHAVVDPAGTLSVDVIDGLESLVGNSLVRAWHDDADPTRFGMLQTIRDYALAALYELGEFDEIRRVHAGYFRDMARKAASEMLREDLSWPDRLEVEHDNLRAALQTAMETGSVEDGLGMATCLWRFWQLRSHLAEGRTWLSHFFARPVDGVDPQTRAAAMLALGGLAYWQNDYATTRPNYEEALSIYQSLGDRRGVAEALYNLGFLSLIEGDSHRSREMHERSLSIYAEQGDELNVAFARWGLAMSALRERDLEKAREYGLDSLHTFSRHHNWFGKSLGEFILVQVERFTGNHGRALELLHEALMRPESQKNASGLSYLIELQADTEIAMGRPRRGLKLAAGASQLRAEYGGGAPPPLLDLEDPRTLVSSDLSQTEIDGAWNEGLQMSVNEIVEYALKHLDEDE